MHRQNGLDPLPAVRQQRGADPFGIDRRLPPMFEDIHLDSQALGHFRPAVTKSAGRRDQHRLARCDHIHQRRLPDAMAIGDIHRNMALRPRDMAQVRDQTGDHLVQVRRIDVRRRPMHGLKHPVGHHGRPRQGHMGAS